MKITSLEIENFLSIGKAELTGLDSMGLVLIQGENMDDPSASSNGSGKSALIDGISWCLYGETARGVSGDEVVNNIAGKGTRVGVVVEDAGVTYRITRHRKHRTGKNRLELERSNGTGGWDELTGGTDKLTQDLVNTVTGCSPSVFKAGIYAGQEAMPDLPGMTDKELKVLVEEAAGIDRLQHAYEVAREKASEAEKSLFNANNECNHTEALVSRLVTQVETMKDGAADYETKRADRILRKQSEASRIEKEIVSCLSSLTAGAIREVKQALDAVKAERVAQAGIVEDLKLAETAERAAYGAHCHADSNLKAAANVAARLKTELDTIAARVGKPCRTCGKPIEASELETAREHAQNGLTAELKLVRERRIAAEDALRALESARERTSELRDSATSVSELADRQHTLERKLDGFGLVKRQHERLVLEQRRIGEDIDTIRAEENPFLGHTKRAKVELDAAQTTLIARREGVQALKETLETCKKVVQVFGPAGVRAHILDTVTPFLNGRTAHYLGVLSDGNIVAEWTTVGLTKAGELREQFNITVENAKGAKNYQAMSGGEKRKVRLATAMALQDLVATRATKPIKLFIADEIDDALDDSALERLMSLLEEKAREKGTVLVVSHNSLRDWIRNVLVVRKKGGISTVEVES